MAQVPLVPVTLNPAVVKGQIQFFNSPVVNGPTGTPINLSAWVSLQAIAIPPTPNPTGADQNIGTVTAASTGIVTFEWGATDLSAFGPGTARFIIQGKPTSGDAVQLLCSGTLTLIGS